MILNPLALLEYNLTVQIKSRIRKSREDSGPSPRPDRLPIKIMAELSSTVELKQWQVPAAVPSSAFSH
jgi:hypothetical protein